MLLSVIVPIYNVSGYLEQCLESIICSRRNDIEIILIDDGSTDSSGSICDQYVSIDNRCKVIHKKNGGLSDARNLGLAYATSEYVLFIDSDDYLMPQTIDILLTCLEKNTDVDVIQFRYIKVWDNCIERYSDSGMFIFYDNEQAYRNHIQGKKITRTVWDKIYKRVLFEGILYPSGYLAEDYGTTYKILNRAQKILFYDKVLYCYRQRENSIMSNNKIQLFLDEYDLGIEFYKYNLERYPNCSMLANSEHINLLLKTNYRILIHPDGGKEKARRVFEKADAELKEMKHTPCQLRTRIVQHIYFTYRPLFVLIMRIKFRDLLWCKGKK